MTITLGNMLFRAFAAVLLAMICAACGVPTLIEVNEGSHRYQDSLLVTVALNDSVFTEQEISDFIRLDDTVYPMLRLTPQFDSLQRARRPQVTLSATNIGSIPLKVMTAHWNARLSTGCDEFPAVYGIGNREGALTPVRRPNIVRTDCGFMPGWLASDAFLTIEPHQSIILEDSIDVLALDDLYEPMTFPPGRYWIAFTYRNSWVREGKTNYWTGSISTDTVYFEVK